MRDNIKDNIFETIVDIGEKGEVVKDDKGFLVYGEGDIIAYIPTIYDEGVFIKKAYIKESRYQEDYAYLNEIELVIEEESNDKISGWASRFSRTNKMKMKSGFYICLKVQVAMLGRDKNILINCYGQASLATSSNKMFPFATHIPSPGAITARKKGFEGLVQERRKQGDIR